MIIPGTWVIIYPWYAVRALKQNSSAVSLDVYVYRTRYIPDTAVVSYQVLVLYTWYLDTTAGTAVHGTRRKKGPHAVHMEPDPTLLRTWLFRYCTSHKKRILSLPLPPCCHLCPPLHRPEDEGRGYPRRDSRGDRSAFLRRGFLLGPAVHDHS